MGDNMYGTFYSVDGADNADESEDNLGSSSITTFDTYSDDSSSVDAIESSSEIELESSTSEDDDNYEDFSVIEENSIGGYGTVDLEKSNSSESENEIAGYGTTNKSEDESENVIAGYGTITKSESESENVITGYGTVTKSESESDNEIAGYGTTNKSEDESENVITGYGTIKIEDELQNEIAGYGTTNKSEDESENEITGYGTTNKKEKKIKNEISGYGTTTDKLENEITGYSQIKQKNKIEGYGNTEISENEIGGYNVDLEEDEILKRERELSEKPLFPNKKQCEKKSLLVQSKKKRSVITKRNKTTPIKKSNNTSRNLSKAQTSKTETKKKLKLSESQGSTGSTGSESENKPAFNTNNCYWNTEFQHALDMEEGRAQWTKLAKLAHDFVYCSKTYGKIIITEYYLPENEKTIKSIDAGGLAGGSKYICSNIFFKFALDTDLTEDTREKKNLTIEQLPPMWMYGGSKPDDYAAMKAAKNDMTGLMSFYNAKIPGLYFPLMSLIDYRGFRLIAMSILPISRTTIKYGSADGGKTIHKANKEINKKMQEAAELLNLKGHRTGLQRIMVWGPGDIEAHEGRDNKYYVVDFGRTFPPEAPMEPGSRKIFYCLLRPEFVRMYKKPLSSDAFSCWGKCNSRIHNQEVREASEYLYKEVIPKFAKELHEKKANVGDIRLTESLHSSGINCRHLGRVRIALPADSHELSKLLITEMVARLLSGLLRQLLRIEMKRTKVASQEPYKTVVIDFLNAILHVPSSRGISDIAPILNNDSTRISFRLSPEQLDNLSNEMNQNIIQETEINMGSKTLQEVTDCSYLRGTYFWTRDIKEWLSTKFKECLYDDETHRRYNLRDSINTKLLLVRLCKQSGIKLSKHAMEEFFKYPDDFQVLNYDLRKVSARIKHLNVIDEAEGNLLFLEARNHSHREGLWDATNEKFARAVCSNTNNPATFVRWGSILLKQCKHFRSKPSTSLIITEKLLEEAEEKFLSALKLNPRMYEAKFELANTYVFRGTLIHLYKPEDTIAVSLWCFEDAMKYYYSAFSSNGKYFQKVLILVDEIFQQAQSLINPLKAEIRSELYLRGFFMIHCAISVSPQIPDSTTFMLAGTLLKEYLSCGGSASVGNYIYGLAASYLESAFLKIPSAFDGQLVYFHQKSLYQIQRCGTQPNLSSIRKSEDVIYLYKIEENSKNSEQRLCSLLHSVEVPEIKPDFPIMFFPIITEDPSSNYHQVRSLNRLFNLSNIEWNNICKEGEFPQLPIIKFNRAACTFALTHSPFYSFSLTKVKIILPKLDSVSRNVGLPSKISLYGSNSQNRWDFTELNIKNAINGDKQSSTLLNMFHIHTQEITSTGNQLIINIEIPSTIKPSRILVIHIIPPENIREIGLCKLSFQGHQVYLSNLPHVIKPESVNLRRTIRKGSLGNKTNASIQEIKSTKVAKGWESASIRGLQTRLSWSQNHSDMISLDPTGHTLRVNDLSLSKSRGKIRVFSCQGTTPISFASAPSAPQKKTPLLRNRASVNLKIKDSQDSSSSSLLSILDGPYCTLWIDDKHHTNEVRTLCQLTKNKSKKLELLKFKSLHGAIDWLEERTSSDNDSSTENTSLSGLIHSKNFRIICSSNCNNNNNNNSNNSDNDNDNISIEDILFENELWKFIPILIYNSDTNPIETNTYRQREDRILFITNCARATVEFASFQLLYSDLNEIPINRSGAHRFFAKSEVRKSDNFPHISRSKRTISFSKSKSENVFYYYEVTILQLHAGSNVLIGLAPQDFPIEGTKLGTTPLSFAFKNTGSLWCGWTNKHCKFPSKASFSYKQNDIIGCGYDVRSQTIFWTKNGKYLGPAERGHSRLLDHNTKLFPAITVIGKATLRANFGKTRFLFDLTKLSSFTHPKLSNPNKKERVSIIHPFSSDLFTGALEKHNMDLLVLSVLSQFSRSLNLLLRAHISHWQTNKASRNYVSLNLVDSPELKKIIPMTQVSYSTIDLTNTLERGNDLHLCSLWSLMPNKRPNTLDISGWQALSNNLFKRLLNTENIQTLHLTNCNFDDSVAYIISERLTNLINISLWSSISEQGIISICSLPSLRKIDFTNCTSLSDSILISALKSKSSKDSYELLNFTNCQKITDHGLGQLVSKAGNVIKGLRSLNLNYCDNITTVGIMKLLNCCKQLQHVYLASNPSTNGMTDQVVSLIAEEYNQKLQTLVLIRSTNLSPVSMKVIAAKCNNLTYLDLAHCCNLTDESLQWIAESGSNLIKLDLFNTATTDLTALSFVTNHQHLRYLSFSRCNNLSPYGIIKCLKHLKEIEFLSLRENNLKDEVLRALSTSSLPRLVLIDVSSCAQISDDVVKSLRSQLPRVLVNVNHDKSKKYQSF